MHAYPLSFMYPPAYRTSTHKTSSPRNLLRQNSPVKAEAVTDEHASDSLSVFPSFFPRWRCDDIRKKILTSVDNKDQYRIAPMLNKDQVLKLLEKLKDQLAKLNDGEVNKHLEYLFDAINKLEDPVISIGQWADMSLRLETLLGLLTKHSNDALPSLAYIKLTIKNLEYVCRFNWMQHAYERIIDQFTQAFVKLIVTNSAANYVKTAKGTVEASTPLSIMSVGGSAGYQVSFSFDDEGYGKTYRIYTGDFGISFKLPFLKLGGQIAGIKGEYNYCRTARDHAICYFNDLLANNHKSPEIAQYLSRRRTLGVQDKTNEVEDFYIAQKDYVLTEKAIARNFALFLSLDYSGELTVKKEDLFDGEKDIYIPSEKLKENQSVTHQPKIAPSAGPVEGNKKKAVVVSGKIDTTTGTLSGKAGLDTLIYEGSATLKGEYSKRVTRNTRYTTLCDLLDNQYANSNPAFKKKLKEDVRESGFAIRKKIHANWYPRPKNEFALDDATCALIAVEYQRNPDSFKPDFVSRLAREPAFIRYATEKAPEIFLSPEVNRLNQDLEFLENLHAQRAMGNTDVEQSIAKFYKIYGAGNVEECLKNMAVLAAYFYELLGDKKPEALAKRIKNLETRIYATGIPHRPDVLRKLAGASQNYYSITSDKTVEFSLKNGFRFSFARTTAPGLGFKVNRKDLSHYNPSRSGKSYNFEITLSGETGADRQIIKALAAYLRHDGAHEMAELFDSEYFANVSVKGTFMVRYFLPKDPVQMQMVKLDKRLIKQIGFEISPSVPIGIPGFANIAVGVNYSSSTTSLVRDMPSPDTMFYFNLHYMHALFTGTIPYNKKTLEEDTREKGQDSYWHVLVRKHRKTLEQLFLNIAQEKLSAEFDHLKRRYLSYGASKEERVRVETAQRNFLTSAERFQETGADEDYQKALENFKTFMRTLFDHWMWTRELSEAFEPYQYEFHSTPGALPKPV